jgi:hypothetical protein
MRILTIINFIALLPFLLLLGPFHFVVGDWLDAAIYDYIGVSIYSITWYTRAVFAEGPEPVTFAQSAAFVLATPFQRIMRLLAGAANHTGAAGLSINWPILSIGSIRLLAGLHPRTTSNFLTHISRPEEWLSPLYEPTWTLLCVLAAFGYSYAGYEIGTSEYLLFLLLTAAALLRYVKCVLSPGSLVELVHLRTDTPRIFYLLILFSEGLSVILLLSITASRIVPRELTALEVYRQMGHLYSYTAWLDLLHGSNWSISNVMWSTVGAAFNLAILRTAFSGLTTTLSSRDLKTQAQVQLEKKDFVALKGTLSKLGEVGERDEQIAMMEAAACLATDEIEDAREAISFALSAQRLSPDNDLVFHLLVGTAEAHRLNDQVWVKSFEDGIKHDVSDTFLSIALVMANAARINFDGIRGAIGFVRPGTSNWAPRLAATIYTYPVAYDLMLGLLQKDDPSVVKVRLMIREGTVFARQGLNRLAHLVLNELALPVDFNKFFDLHFQVELKSDMSATINDLRTPAELIGAQVCLGLAFNFLTEIGLNSLVDLFKPIFEEVRSHSPRQFSKLHLEDLITGFRLHEKVTAY